MKISSDTGFASMEYHTTPGYNNITVTSLSFESADGKSVKFNEYLIARLNYLDLSELEFLSFIDYLLSIRLVSIRDMKLIENLVFEVAIFLKELPVPLIPPALYKGKNIAGYLHEAFRDANFFDLSKENQFIILTLLMRENLDKHEPIGNSIFERLTYLSSLPDSVRLQMFLNSESKGGVS